MYIYIYIIVLITSHIFFFSMRFCVYFNTYPCVEYMPRKLEVDYHFLFKLATISTKSKSPHTYCMQRLIPYVRFESSQTLNKGLIKTRTKICN